MTTLSSVCPSAAFCASDAEDFGGTGIRNAPEIRSEDVPFGALPCCARVTLPPLSTVYFTFTNR